MNKGRPLDPVWEHFEGKDGNKSKCLECGSESAPLVERMRTHFNKYHVAKDGETPNPRKQIKIKKFVKTAILDNDKLDVSVAKFFYANNISFNCVDSVTFKNLVNDLHPGYKPPNRKPLAGQLLDTACAELEGEAKKATNGSKATFCLDGWSNVANDPIIASSIQVSNKVHIVDIIDTNDEKHTSVNLARIAQDHMKKPWRNTM